MNIETAEGQVQAHFKTKQQCYAVPDVPYAVEGSVSTTELNSLINSILNNECKPEFEFLVFGEYLRGRLCDHLRDKAISFEEKVEIEFVERFPAPEAKDCLLHDDWVSAVKTNGKWILTGSYDNTVNIWTVKGKSALTIPGHTKPVKAVDWISLDDDFGIFVTCSQDQTAMLWRWSISSNSVECVNVCKGHERSIDCVSVCPKAERFATGSWDTMLKLWSTELQNESTSIKNTPSNSKTKIPLLTLQGHRECISSVKWLDSNTLLSGSWDHTLKIWDLELEGLRSEIPTNKSIFDADYSALNQLIITASADKNIRLYDPRTNQSIVVRNTFLGHTQWVQSVMWSTTEEYLFVSGANDNQNKLWDCRSPKAPLYDMLGHGDKVFDIDWSNPKYIVSGGADNTVRVYKSRKAVNDKEDEAMES